MREQALAPVRVLPVQGPRRALCRLELVVPVLREHKSTASAASWPCKQLSVTTETARVQEAPRRALCRLGLMSPVLQEPQAKFRLLSCKRIRCQPEHTAVSPHLPDCKMNQVQCNVVLPQLFQKSRNSTLSKPYFRPPTSNSQSKP